MYSISLVLFTSSYILTAILTPYEYSRDNFHGSLLLHNHYVTIGCGQHVLVFFLAMRLVLARHDSHTLLATYQCHIDQRRLPLVPREVIFAC